MRSSSKIVGYKYVCYIFTSTFSKKFEKICDLYLYKNRFDLENIYYQNDQRKTSTNAENFKGFGRGRRIGLEISHGYTLHYILFEKDFNDCSSERVDTTTTTNITDAERRMTFINEMNIILSKRSKEKEHLLSSLILQLIKLRFPNELDKYKPPNSGIDVFIQQFVQ